MEVCKTVLALDFVDPELDFAEGVVFVVLEIGEGDFEDPAFECVICVLETSCPIHERLANSAMSLDSLGPIQ